MIALEPAIVTRLAAALPAPWTVKGESEAGPRSAWPLALVGLLDGNVPNTARAAAMVQIAWRVTLIARKHAGAAATLDAAFAAAIQALHGWHPGVVSGRAWERMALLQARTPDPADDGLVGIEATFTTAASYDGHPDSY